MAGLAQEPNGKLGELLRSREADPKALAEAMVAEYYAPIFLLALAMLGKPKAAHQTCLSTFAWAINNARHFPRKSDLRIWLFTQALKAIQHVQNQGQPLPAERPPEMPGGTSIPTSLTRAETRLLQTVEAYGPKERQVAILYYLLGWPEKDIANLLHVSEHAVQAQLNLFRSEFAKALASLPAADKQLFEKGLSVEEGAALTLRKRWPAPQLSGKEVEGVAGQILELARQESLAQQRARPLKITAITVGILAGVTILAGIFLVGMMGYLQLRRQAAITPGTGAQAIPSPTSFGPAPETEPLSRSSSSQEILQRIQESASLWSTLWIEVQSADSGPQGYIGLPKVYRAQAWISQPSRSLELFGVLGEQPSSYFWVNEEQSVSITPVTTVLLSLPWNPEQDSLVQSDILNEMIFPASAPWANRPGIFNPTGSDRVADRRTIVVDWINPQGGRERRLWVDAITGMILRKQEFGGGDYKLLTSDSLATGVAYDVELLYPALDDPAQITTLDFTPGSVRTSGGGGQAFPTPTTAPSTSSRAPLAPQAPPADFDPSRSKLDFQFPQDARLALLKNIAEVPAELFADGYSLGNLSFGLPWGMRCDRSPDGQRLAYTNESDGTTRPNASLRWLNLANPMQVYQPMPELAATSFAFAPDSRHLAVFGFGQGSTPSGVYLIDVGTGEHELLLGLEEGRSLVWSPDGNYLALVGRIFVEDEEEVFVIQMLTRQVIHQFGLRFLDEQSAADWPMAAWGVAFPVEMGGMEVCTALPP